MLYPSYLIRLVVILINEIYRYLAYLPVACMWNWNVQLERDH